MTSQHQRVAVLGAGIMGSSLALFLSRRGRDVTLVDQASAPMAGASRWNEGKIHLGYLYGADPTLQTAHRIIPGGLLFGRFVSDLIGSDIESHTTTSDDTYLVHRDSVVGEEALRAQFDDVSALIRNHPDSNSYLVDVSAARAVQLDRAELDEVSGSAVVVAGFRVPERSVDTRWVADRFVDAIAAESRISTRTGITITSATPVGSIDGPWRVRGLPDFDEWFDVVVNALWHGRLAIDLTAGLLPEYDWSHRYRLSVFARTRQPLDIKSAIVAVGPFGDIKNYNGRDFYLSWYPVGLVAQSTEVSLAEPPPLSPAGQKQFIRDVRAALEGVLPSVGGIFEAAEEFNVRGGFVYARGGGSLGDPASTLHRRDQFGIERCSNYYSVDTGKYSTAPWLADVLARQICGD